MTARQKELIWMSMIYLQANLDDAIEAFESGLGDETGDVEINVGVVDDNQIRIDGVVIQPPTHKELDFIYNMKE